jgi:hypothetical protein
MLLNLSIYENTSESASSALNLAVLTLGFLLGRIIIDASCITLLKLADESGQLQKESNHTYFKSEKIN